MPNKKLSATRALKRHDSGTMYQVGIADQCEIPLNRQNMMKQVAKRRKRLTTRPEAKLCFAFQVMKWGVGDVIHYQREKTIHLADMLSRSLDFYFNTTKLAVEADGTSHDGELARAKDDWTDRLMKEAGISMLRFRNEFIRRYPSSGQSQLAAEDPAELRLGDIVHRERHLLEDILWQVRRSPEESPSSRGIDGSRAVFRNGLRWNPWSQTHIPY